MPGLNIGFGEPSGSGGAGDGSTTGNTIWADRIADVIRRNDKNAKRISSMQAKILHQRDIHSKRMRDFVEKAIEMLQAIQRNTVDEMDVTLRQRQDDLANLHKRSTDHALELRSLKDHDVGMTLEDFNHIQEAMAAIEQWIESLSAYDLVISPQMAGFLDTLQHETKPAYIRTSPLLPIDVELSLVPISNATSNILQFTVMPSQAEPRLSVLLAGTLGKFEMISGNTVGVRDTAIQGVITILPDRDDGACQVTFTLDEQSDRGGVDGDYLIKVTIYGRHIKYSPMKVRVSSETNTVQVLSDERRRDEATTADVTPPPPAPFADGPSATNRRLQSRHETTTTTSQSIAATREAPTQVRDAPRSVAVSSPPPIVPGAPALLRPVLPPPNDNQAQQRLLWSAGVGRGRPPASRAPAAAAPGPNVARANTPTEDPIQEMDDFLSKAVDTTVKPVREKYGDIAPNLEAANVRLPHGISTTESIVTATDRLLLDDHLGPSQGYAASVVSTGLYGDETLDLTHETLRFRSNTLTFEESNAMANTVASFQGGAGSLGAYRSPRADLTGLLGDEDSPRNISGILVAKFGREKRQDPPDQCFYFPIGCTKDNLTGDFIICDTGHHVVKIFDGETNLKQINNAVFHRPAAVISLDDKRYAIRDDQCIQIFTKENELLRTFGGKLSGRAYGLAMDTNGNLVTLELGRRNCQSHVLTYDPSSGEEISRVLYTAHCDKPASKCRFIDCFNDRLYVADLGASYIYCTSLESGVNVLEFGGPGSMPGKFAEPSGISIDANGNLFIGDSRHDRIQIFSPNGTYMGMVKFDYPIKRPSGIHLTADGHLMVTNYLQHYVALFKLVPLRQ